MSEQDELRALRKLVAQLTERVYRLEQLVHAPVSASSSARPDAAAVAPESATHAEPAVSEAARTPEFHGDGVGVGSPDVGLRDRELRSRESQNRQAADLHRDSLERRIGSQWLNRVGVVAVLVGVSYFLKLAFEIGWIGPGLRMLIGLMAGVGLCWWSERFRRPNSLAFSYSLKAVGAGILYLSLWASIPALSPASGSGRLSGDDAGHGSYGGIAVAQDAELLAGLALLGGLLTPCFAGIMRIAKAALFCYLLLLSLGAFVLQRVEAVAAHSVRSFRRQLSAGRGLVQPATTATINLPSRYCFSPCCLLSLPWLRSMPCLSRSATARRS